MTDINQITCFQNKKRIVFLAKFRDKLSEYFDNAGMNTLLGIWVENERARELRQDICFDIEKAAKTITATHINIHMRQFPAPMTGGTIIDFDLIRNVLYLHSFGVNNEYAFDIIDMAIGAYEANKGASILRTVNPLFYIDLFLTYLTSRILLPLKPLLPKRAFSVLINILKALEYVFLIYQVYTQVVVKYVGRLL